MSQIALHVLNTELEIQPNDPLLATTKIHGTGSMSLRVAIVVIALEASILMSPEILTLGSRRSHNSV